MSTNLENLNNNLVLLIQQDKDSLEKEKNKVNTESNRLFEEHKRILQEIERIRVERDRIFKERERLAFEQNRIEKEIEINNKEKKILDNIDLSSKKNIILEVQHELNKIQIPILENSFQSDPVYSVKRKLNNSELNPNKIPRKDNEITQTRYKTSYCISIKRGETCKQINCTFAHNYDELNILQKCNYDKKCSRQYCRWFHSNETKEQYWNKLLSY